MADDQPTPEEWRDAVGHEGRFMVSSHGRVWSKDRMVRHGRGSGLRRHAGRMLSQGKKPAGYPVISALIDGKVRHLYVHTLVLEAFVGPRPAGAVARHLDDNKENNHLSNLAWGTESDNAYDKVRNGNDHYAKRDACKNGHLFTPDNIYRRAKYPGTRYCKACAMDEQRRRRAKRAAYKKQWRDRRRAEGLPVT